jgi:hypothetical protein
MKLVSGSLEKFLLHAARRSEPIDFNAARLKLTRDG